MRDVKEKYTATRVHLLSAFLRAKDPIDKRERNEFPSNRRISAYVRVVVLGVLSFGPENRLFRGCLRPLGLWHRTTLSGDSPALGSTHRWVSCKLRRVRLSPPPPTRGGCVGTSASPVFPPEGSWAW